MTKEEIIRTVRQKIGSANLEGALDFMESIIQEDDEQFDALIMLKSRQVYNERQWQEQKIDHQEYLIRRTHIGTSALNLGKSIEPVTRSPIDVPQEYDTPLVKQLTKDEIFKIALTAKLQRKGGNYAEALKLWHKLPEEKQQKVAFCNEIAMLHRLMNNSGKALILLENMRNNNPYDIRCLNELATCQRERNWIKLALETIKAGLAIDPKNGYLHSNQFFIHLFFTLDKKNAIATRDNYERQFGKPLIENESYRDVYNGFLEQLDAIKLGNAPTELIEQFIEACQGDKRAFQTAKHLQDMLKNR